MDPRATQLEQELISDARRQAEAITGKARDQVAAALASLRTQMAAWRETELAQARHEAELQVRAVVAGTRLEVRRRWLLRREAGFEGLFAGALAALEAGIGVDAERSLRQLLREALEAIGPGSVVVRLAPASAAWLSAPALAEVRAEAWPGAGEDAALRRVVDEALRPGVLVESADGARVFDNTYATRLARLRQPLCALVARSIPAMEGDDDA